MRVFSYWSHRDFIPRPDHLKVSFAHPRTAVLADPGLPVVSTLLGSPIPAPIRAAVDIAGGQVVDTELTQVTWWPGVSITTRYQVNVSGGALDGRQSFVCVGGRIPDGAMIVEGEPGPVGVWRVPHDPALPGLASALDESQTSRLLSELGAEEGPVTTRLRAYRPGRRAVVAVSGRREGIYLKLVRPRKVEELHGTHRFLAATLPVPMSLGFAAEQGLIALQSMPGITLRGALEDPDSKLPAPEEIVSLAQSLPVPRGDRISSSPIERLPDLASMLRVVSPELNDRVDRLVEAIGEDLAKASFPSHGDYYESQLLVDGNRLVGLLDVDTFGWGRAADDAATMLGHLAVWAELSNDPNRVIDFGSRLIRLWDQILDPVDLRVRTAAVALSLATGPFRVQAAGWPGETADRVAIAERWVESASRA